MYNLTIIYQKRKSIYQCSLFLKIRKLVTWLKSTLFLKMKCFDTHIYENKMFTNKKDAALFGKENAWEAGGVRERVWR